MYGLAFAEQERADIEQAKKHSRKVLEIETQRTWDNPMSLASVQFHNPCYGSIAKACAKYFQDSTSRIN